MSKWKVYAMYYAEPDDPFDRCFCGKWRFQGIAYAESEEKAISVVQRKRIGLWYEEYEGWVSYSLESVARMKRRDWVGVLWEARKVC